MRKGFLVVLASLILSASEAEAQWNLYTFSGEVDLGVHYTAFFSSGQHYIGARGDTVYVVSSGYVVPFSGSGNVYCQKSTDGGQSFGLPVVVNSVPPATNPSMRVDTAGIIYVAYQHDADIYFSKSTNGGAGFTPGVKVNDDTIPQIGQEKPSIAINNKRQIFIAWSDQRTAPGQPHSSIFAAVSYDGGMSFSPNVQVNEVSNPAAYQNIAADDSERVYVAYPGSTGGKSGVVLARSIDSGQSFNYHTLASDSPWLAGELSIAASPNGEVGIAWVALRTVDTTLEFILRFSGSSDYGQTFSPSVRVDDDPDVTDETIPFTPSLAYNRGIFYAVWTDAGPNARNSFSYSSDSGQSFAYSKRVNSFSSSQLFPSLAVNESGKAFVAWLDDRNDPIFSEDYHTFVARGVPRVFKGDLNLNGIVNLVDVVLELNAVFFGQPFPAPLEAADGNCDGKLSAADMVLLLNAYYRNIPFPCS